MDIDVNYIKNVVESVLQNRFNSPQRQKVKVRKDHILFACPICGDSASDNTKKRAKLYLKDLWVRCFHMGCNSTLTKLAKDYGVHIDPEHRMALTSYAASNYTKCKADNDFVHVHLDKLIPLSDLQDYFDNNNAFLKAFKPIQKGSRVYDYMVNTRKYPTYMLSENVYQAVHQITPKWHEEVVVFLNTSGGKVIGLQTRNLKSGKDRKFNVHTFEDLYNMLHPGEEIDQTEAIGYNKLCGLFGVFDVDFEKTVTIFEGKADSLYFPNSIGATGTNTDFSILTNSDVDIRFFFDNDSAGMYKSEQYLKSGYKVFLWNKFFDQMAKNTTNYRRYYDVLKDIKDLNRLAIVANTQNPYKEYSLEEYFSKDIYDLKWIDKRKRRPNIEAPLVTTDNMLSVVNSLSL